MSVTRSTTSSIHVSQDYQKNYSPKSGWGWIADFFKCFFCCFPFFSGKNPPTNHDRSISILSSGIKNSVSSSKTESISKSSDGFSAYDHLYASEDESMDAYEEEVRQDDYVDWRIDHDLPRLKIPRNRKITHISDTQWKKNAVIYGRVK